jgi:hypothetical protein
MVKRSLQVGNLSAACNKLQTVSALPDHTDEREVLVSDQGLQLLLQLHCRAACLRAFNLGESWMKLVRT